MIAEKIINKICSKCDELPTCQSSLVMISSDGDRVGFRCMKDVNFKRVYYDADQDTEGKSRKRKVTNRNS
jgi:hypothetical protein